jgi:DNA-binding LacI/PurR family transcriptional regulator
MGDAVTIKDVARRANVSVATVSRALNGHHNVAMAVRERVLGIAGELQYRPTMPPAASAAGAPTPSRGAAGSAR